MRMQISLTSLKSSKQVTPNSGFLKVPIIGHFKLFKTLCLFLLNLFMAASKKDISMLYLQEQLRISTYRAV